MKFRFPCFLLVASLLLSSTASSQVVIPTFIVNADRIHSVGVGLDVMMQGQMFNYQASARPDVIPSEFWRAPTGNYRIQPPFNINANAAPNEHYALKIQIITTDAEADAAQTMFENRSTLQSLFRGIVVGATSEVVGSVVPWWKGYMPSVAAGAAAFAVDYYSGSQERIRVGDILIQVSRYELSPLGLVLSFRELHLFQPSRGLPQDVSTWNQWMISNGLILYDSFSARELYFRLQYDPGPYLTEMP